MTAISLSEGIGKRSAIAPALFTLAIFTSASLLFFVQPLFTRLVLPYIGGAPAVWTTAMLFFQTALIAGYLYAHLLTRHVPVRLQLGLHLALWAAALFFLPLAIPESWSYDASASTAWQTLTLYAIGVGVPFTFLSANAPLIQAWYAKSGGASADDPYFLYGASNLGSLLALLAFPLVAEPLFGMTQIGWGWAAGFGALGILLLACGLTARRDTARAAGPIVGAHISDDPSLRDMARWAVLAFIPSSMMLGITSRISTDLGSFPLVWVIPLALYLLTFVLVFSQKSVFTPQRLRPAFMVALVTLVALSSAVGLVHLNWAKSAFLAFAFFITALMAHRVLYERRPDKAHLTVFYLVMSVGGALGGLFNSILAPLIFKDIYELSVVVALASVLLLVGSVRFTPREATLGLAVGVLALLPGYLGILLAPLSYGVLTAVALAAILLLGLGFLNHRGTAPVVAVCLVLSGGHYIQRTEAIHRDRSFFGTHSILEYDKRRIYKNGTTIHGAEWIADLDGGRPEPLTYYHVDGPMGQIMSSPRADDAKSIGIVGLGLGSLACYAQPGQNWHFYEIDKTVDAIARNPAYFTFMSSCGQEAVTHLGDARIVLAQQPQMKFDILVIDAYGSDAVPIHLTTTEAMALYRDRLTPGGLLVFHISNRFYDIDIPLGRGAEALGMRAMFQHHDEPGIREKGALPSVVVAMTTDDTAITDLASDTRWRRLESDGGPLWTDDYANLLSVLR